MFYPHDGLVKCSIISILIKKYLLVGILSVALTAGFFGKQVLASAWEWIQVFDVIGCDTSCQSATVIALKRNVQTSNNFYEYRGVWAAVVAGASSTEPSIWEYRPLYQCFNEGYVNTSEWDVCDYTAVATSTYPGGPNVTSTVWFRATTNYANCGGYQYTSTPDTTNCGDVYIRSRVITP